MHNEISNNQSLKYIIKNSGTALISLIIFTLGNSLVNTLTTIELESAGINHFVIGLIASLFFAGMTAGSFVMEPFIIRVGHIRAFSALASTITALSILQGLYFNIWFWGCIRFCSGYCIAGLFIVIESWLVCSSNKNNRGKILALYLISLYCAQSFGQQLLQLELPSILNFFAIIGILSSASIVPIAMTRISSPKIDIPSGINLKSLWVMSDTGMATCFIGGILQGVVYLIMPAFLSDISFSLSNIANSMFIAIMGGMLLQYPIGHLSDTYDRLTVTLAVAILTIIVSLLTGYFAFHNIYIFYFFVFFLGGFTFTLYPLGISLACDNITQDQTVGATQGLLLINSIGATVGPLIAPYFNIPFGKAGIMVFFSIIAAIFSCYTYFKIHNRTKVKYDRHNTKFVAMPSSITPAVKELNPHNNE